MAQIHFGRDYPGVVPQAPSGAGTTKYLREDGTWAVPSSSGGSSLLSELEDVNISSPSENQALIYSQVEEKWVNGLPLGLSIINGKIAQTITMEDS